MKKIFIPLVFLFALCCAYLVTDAETEDENKEFQEMEGNMKTISTEKKNQSGIIPDQLEYIPLLSGLFSIFYAYERQLQFGRALYGRSG